MIKNFFSFVFELVKIIFISLAIILPIRYYLIQPFYVKGQSMEPNFYDQEYLIINEISYRLGKPKRGDIVVFRYPKDPQEYYIKRIIGLPGEKVQIKNGSILIFNQEHPDGIELSEPYIPKDVRTTSLTEEQISIGPDQYFVLGDNRNFSRDSRFFGPVDKSFIIGKVLLRGWPFDRVQLFEDQPYNFQTN